MVALTEVLDNIDLLAGSDLLVRWSLREPQNELPTGKETLLPSLYQEKLESCDLPIIFATTFRFLILGERQTPKSSTLSKATSSLCSESSSESILLHFGSLLDSITGCDHFQQKHFGIIKMYFFKQYSNDMWQTANKKF